MAGVWGGSVSVFGFHVCLAGLAASSWECVHPRSTLTFPLDLYQPQEATPVPAEGHPETEAGLVRWRALCVDVCVCGCCRASSICAASEAVAVLPNAFALRCVCGPQGLVVAVSDDREPGLRSTK